MKNRRAGLKTCGSPGATSNYATSTEIIERDGEMQEYTRRYGEGEISAIEMGDVIRAHLGVGEQK